MFWYNATSFRLLAHLFENLVNDSWSMILDISDVVSVVSGVYNYVSEVWRQYRASGGHMNINTYKKTSYNYIIIVYNLY